MEWLARKRYRGLLDLIRELPSASRLNEAIQNDPEEARRIAQHVFDTGDDDQTDKWTPPLRDFDLHATLLREVRNAIGNLQEAVVASAGGKGKVEPFPAPRTEVHTALARIEREWTGDLMSRYGFDPDLY